MIRVVPVPGEREVFQGEYKPVKMGNAAPIAFGGCVLSQCISAGFAALPPARPAGERDYELYSVLGNFLGPASTEVNILFRVEDIRTTKSFATRKVEAWQDLAELPASKAKAKAKGKEGGNDNFKRRIMILLLDFHVQEPKSMLEYSAVPLYAETPVSTSSTSSSSPPSTPAAESLDFMKAVEPFYSTPEKTPSLQQYLADHHTSKTIETYNTIFPLFPKYFDVRSIEKSMGVQKALGVAAERPTSQDHLDLRKRTNSNWFRMLEDRAGGPLKRGESEAALAFYMDGALAFLPLTFTHSFITAAAACSSLELSLRFLRPPRIDAWLLQEQHTEAGGNGRTFSTGRVWDMDGVEIANMTQVGIMRPFPHDKTMHKL